MMENHVINLVHGVVMLNMSPSKERFTFLPYISHSAIMLWNLHLFLSRLVILENFSFIILFLFDYNLIVMDLR